MARIKLPTPDEMSAQQRAIFDYFKINLTRALLRTTGSAEAYLRLGNTFPKSELGARNVEVIITRVAALIVSTLRLITSVRVSDWIEHLRTMRDGSGPVDQDHVMQVYRNIAKHAPRTTSWLSSFGDLSTQEVRKQFAEGLGLVYVGGGQWRRPGDLLRGKDILHDRQRFVAGGPYVALWIALDVREPSLDDCLSYCKSLSGQAYDARTEASLIDPCTAT